MRILVFGATGMLGHKLVQVLGEDAEVWSTIRGDFDDVERYNIFDRGRTWERLEIEAIDNIGNVFETILPDVVINAVGIIKQLPTSRDVIKTLTLNSIVPHRLAELASVFNFRLFCISTDCVFDGVKGNYSEDDIPNAADLYGKSKNLGEVIAPNCLTLRTSIIGRELSTSHSLLEWFLGNRGDRVDGFTNAIYSGFPTIVLADIIKNLIFNHAKLSGLYHLSSAPISKFELLTMINQRFSTNIQIERFDEFKIDRSLDSTKFRNETGFSPSSWETMIDRMAGDPTPYDKWRK